MTRGFQPRSLAVAFALGALLLPSPPAGADPDRLESDGATLVVCEELPLPTSGRVCDANPGPGAGIVVRGNVLDIDTLYEGGEVLVDGTGFILHVGCREDRPSYLDGVAAGSTELVCRDGAVSPGRINPHTHTTFDSNFPVTLEERFDHRNDWRPFYSWDAGHSLQAGYAELRHVMAGTTATASGSYIPGLALNLEVFNTQWDTFPLEAPLDFIKNDAACADFPEYGDFPGKVVGSEYLPHLSEGIDAAAQNEFACLEPFMDDSWTLLHGVGTDAADGRSMAEKGVGLVWSPRGNAHHYGNTAPVRTLADQGVLLSLGSDWTPTGSSTLARELACAAEWNESYLDRRFSDRELWLMSTYNAALSLGVDEQMGRLAPGLLANLVVYDGSGRLDPYGVAVDGGPEEIAFVLQGDVIPLSFGQPPKASALYGDLELMTAMAGSPVVAGCEVYREPWAGSFDVCGIDKFVCTDRPETRSAAGPFAQFWLLSATIHDAGYQSVFGPSYPLFSCGAPVDEPPCTPARFGEYDGIPVGGPASTADYDGDGVVDNADNCRKVFNPIRPMDGGVQADADGDGRGDACDKCPLDAGALCTAIDPYTGATVLITDGD